ncbi:MAG: SNF2-related protein [Clostridia bacterium]
MRATMTERQFALLYELYQRGSMNSLSNAVAEKELAVFQTVAVAHGVISESCLFNVDTGLGKTLIATGIINVLRKLKPGLRWIFVCQCSNIRSTYQKLSEGLYDSNVVYSDSTEDSILEIFFTRRAVTADVIILSYEAIVSPCVEEFLFKNRHIFKGIFIDESQLISNLNSHTSKLISAICNNCTFKYALTATPLRINIDQVINQIYMIDRRMFDGESLYTFSNQFKVWTDGRVTGYQHLDELQQLLAPRMFSFTRSELGMRGNYKPIPVICDTHKQYKDIPKLDQLKVVKSDVDGPALRMLASIVGQYIAQGKTGLIYSNLNIIKRTACQYLQDLGYRVGILDGTTTGTQAKKEKVHKAFLNGEYDVLITNITTGKDLPCDYIVFYEQTFDYKQMLGRGERGLKGSDLDIVFILCTDTYEIEFFYNNVYQRGLLLEELCGKDLSELRQAVRKMEALLGSKTNIRKEDLVNAASN